MSNPTELPDLDRLEALARAATPGPWAYQEDSDAYTHIVRPTHTPGRIVHHYSQDTSGVVEANARFTAGANPAAVLALITLARRAQPEGARLLRLQTEVLKCPGLNIMNYDDEHVVALEHWATHTVRVAQTMLAEADFRADAESSAKPEGEAPQAVVQVHLDNDNWMDVASSELPTWERKGFKTRTLSTAPAAQHAESGAQVPFRERFKEAYETLAVAAFASPFWDQSMEGLLAAVDAELNKRAALAAQSQGAQAALREAADYCDQQRAGTSNYAGQCADVIRQKLMPKYAAQQAAAPGALALLNADELAALRRFDETCQDGEGYDVSKAMMQRLAAIGVVRRTSGSYYETTDFGMRVLDQPAPSAPGTPEAPDDDADGALLRTVVSHGMQLHFEGRGEDDAVWVDDQMKWSEGDRLGATRALIAEAAKQRAAQLDGGQGEGAANG